METNLKKYKLINVSQVLKWEDSILLVDDEITVLEPYNANLMSILEKLLTGASIEELHCIGDKQNINIEELLESLAENGILSEYVENKYWGTIIEKQWDYFEGLMDSNPNICQKNIETSSVCVVGLGGVGTIIIDSLMRAGVKKFIIIDCDEVSITNLNRQIMYNEKDIGLRKTDCISAKIVEYDADIEVQKFDKKIENVEDLSMVDEFSISIIINAADKPNNIADIIYEYAQRRNIAAITGAVGRNQGSWGPLIVPEETQTYESFKDWEYERMENYEKFILKNSLNPMNVSFGPINAITSYFLSKDVIMYIAGATAHVTSYGVRCGFDFLNMQFVS